MVIACGVWSPAIARMAGAVDPAHAGRPPDDRRRPGAAVRQRRRAHIEFPIVRDMDAFMYERQDGVGLEIGSYAHRPILHDPEEIPSIEEAALSPTELPFTQADFEPQMEHALELMPEIVGDESVGVKYAINGLLVADARRHAAAGRDARGAAASGRAPRCGSRRARASAKSVAEWMVHGESEIDLHSLGHRPLPRAPEDARARPRAHVARASTRPTASSTRPSSGRPTATCGCRRSTRASRSSAPSSSRPPAGSARSGTSPTRRCSRSTATAQPARGRVGRALVVADHQRRAPRDARARRHVRPLARSPSSTSAAPARWRRVQRVAMRQMDVPVGRVVYTPLLTPGGGFRSDLTIMRLGRRAVPRRHRRRARHGRPQVVPRPPARRRLGAARRRHVGLDDARPVGPARARHPVVGDRATTSRTRASGSAPAGRSRSARCGCWPRGSRTSATSAGSSTCRSSRARGCGTCSGRPASRTASCRVRHRRLRHDRPAREVLPRLRRSSSRASTTSVEAGMAGREGQGRRTSSARRRTCATASEEPAAMLCTLTVDDHTSAARRQALHARPRADPDARRRSR